MDKVFIKNLNIITLIGLYTNERSSKQNLVVDIELGIDAKKSSINENLNYTVDYDKLVTWIINESALQEFKLLETLAEYLCKNIIKIFGVTWIQLSLTKPNAIKETKDVGVCITREAKDY